MLISDRTYTSQTCSNVWTEGYAEIYPGLHNYAPNWQNINSGYSITDPSAMQIVSGGNFDCHCRWFECS